MAGLIRMATEADAAAIAAIYAPFCTDSAVSFEETPPTVEEMARRIRTVTVSLPWLVLEDGPEPVSRVSENDNLAGYVYAHSFRDRAAYRWSVEVTVYVHPRRHRRGMARALYAALFRILTLQGFYKMYAGVTIPNLPSESLHEAVGMRSVGVYHGVGYKLGAWHDVRFYEMSLQAEQPVPEPPRSVHALPGTPEWNLAVDAGRALYRP